MHTKLMPSTIQRRHYQQEAVDASTTLALSLAFAAQEAKGKQGDGRAVAGGVRVSEKKQKRQSPKPSKKRSSFSYKVRRRLEYDKPGRKKTKKNGSYVVRVNGGESLPVHRAPQHVPCIWYNGRNGASGCSSYENFVFAAFCQTPSSIGSTRGPHHPRLVLR